MLVWKLPHDGVTAYSAEINDPIFHSRRPPTSSLYDSHPRPSAPSISRSHIRIGPQALFGHLVFRLFFFYLTNIFITSGVRSLSHRNPAKCSWRSNSTKIQATFREIRLGWWQRAVLFEVKWYWFHVAKQQLAFCEHFSSVCE